MKSTQARSGVLHPASDFSHLGSTLAARQLAQRATHVRHAANGQPIEPTMSGVANIRRAMHAVRSKEWERILRVAVCDAKDGVPLDAVLLTFFLAIEEVRTRAIAMQQEPQLAAVQIDEMNGEHALNLAQRMLDERPECPIVNAKVVQKIDTYIPKLSVLRDRCARRAVVHA